MPRVRPKHCWHLLAHTRRALAATEARLAASTARVQECEQETQQLQGQVCCGWAGQNRLF